MTKTYQDLELENIYLKNTLSVVEQQLEHYQVENNMLRSIIINRKSWMQKHIYKLEMNRLRRKLTRIYEAVAIMHDNECVCPSVDAFKKM